MEGDTKMRQRCAESKDLKMLGRILRRGQSRCTQESEALIVAMVADEEAALPAPRSQVVKPCLDELRAYPAPLKRWLNRDRAKGEPALQRKGSHLGECDVANNLLADYSDERQEQRIGLAQDVEDEGFRSVAEREASKRTGSERSNGIMIGDRFWSDQNG
jgi:hypothetical protein